ncbi:Serine/threonine-protein phosphatase 6 regulatory ankyrin repeat subunit C [Araneus ventricosus]|uniref:Serine/threonine-protein phosphatase 6 regulatory ankyrin repeat subunit C n=1 Tax=Araneus ventricosus TaxID=182803 RepID=A0A4Y2B322_ARAVE|nr:Serine/threonine-protein phosphatase 6 regulatory ankyrin repeat subunit C [Araneus ventricosus]
MEEEIHRSITAISEEANGENALKILYMSAYFAPAKSIHLDMFLCVFNDIEDKLDALILLLKNKSLIESFNKESFFVNKIVQKEIRTILKRSSKEKDILKEVIKLQTFHLLKDEIHPNYIDHALSLLTYVREFDELVKTSLGLPSHIVTALRRHNRLGEAYVFGETALKFLEKAVGESHPEALTLRHNLATVLDAGGQYTKAVKVLEALNEKDLKYSKVEEITKSLVLHAKELCELSKYKDALLLYQTILGEKIVLDTFDSEILTAWHDYALLLSDMGRYSEAITILQDVLSQKRRVLEDDDEYGFLTRQSLAYVYQAQGNYIQALKKLKEVFHESTKFHGELHPDTLRAERDIGILLQHKGDYKKALKKLEDVEKKFKQIFDESHPDILSTRANIIANLINQEEYNEALHLSKTVYETYKNTFGEEHNETLRVKYNISKIYLKQGKLSEADKILREVYEGFHAIFGPEHVETVKLVAELGLLGYLPTTLHEAAQKGDLSKIVSFIEIGEDVNKADVEGRRPLHYAALNGHVSAAKYLLKMGAMYNAEDFRSATPYELASDEQMENLLNSVTNLFKDVKRGARANIASHTELINAKDKNGYSLLHWAVYNSRKHVVKQLLSDGADPKCISLKGNTPLHVASSKGHREVAEILLQSVIGKDLSHLVNYKTTLGGNTALHVAVENSDLDMVKCLLMYCASYDIKNKERLIPVQLSTNQSVCYLLNVIQDIFSKVLEGNSDAITQLKLLNNDNLSIVTRARNSQGHTLLQVAIENKHKSIIHELLQLLYDLNNRK